MSELDDVLVPISVLESALCPEQQGQPEHRRHLDIYLALRDLSQVETLRDLDARTVYYTQLFHFHAYVRAEVALRGPDAGLEQQAFQLLELAPADVDWDVVEQLLGKAGQS